jgi:hypothetical protein
MIPSSISDPPGHAPEPSSAEQTTQTRRGWVPALPRIDITTDDTLSDVSKDQREPHRHLSDEICEVLRRVRLSKGWSYRAAARATGVDAGYCATWSTADESRAQWWSRHSFRHT